MNDEPVRTIEHLAWDSKHFGFPIGRLTPSALSPADLPDIVQTAKKTSLRCVYLLLDLSCVDQSLSLSLAQHGFGMADLRLTMHVALPGSHKTKTTRVEPADLRSLNDLLDMAAHMHTETRFFTDAKFPRKAAEDLYRIWLTRDHHNPEAVVYVAKSGSDVVGYISCTVASKQAAIGLLGVSSAARGQGMGKELIAAAQEFAGRQGAYDLSVVTQGRNISAIRAYEASGFRTQRLQVWYHLWL